jgi:hypothetical protein
MDRYNKKQTLIIYTLQDMTGKLTEVGRRYKTKIN